MKKVKKVLIISVVLLIVYFLCNVGIVYFYSLKDEKQKADVAIVLGAATYNGTVSPVYQERINHAYDLYEIGYIRKIIVTGGMGKGNTESDAQAAKDYLVSLGVPESAVYTENTSTVTSENLKNAEKIMLDNGMYTAIIISDPMHMRRAMLMARDAAITAYSSPTDTTLYKSFKAKSDFLLKETVYYIGYKWYRIFTLKF